MKTRRYCELWTRWKPPCPFTSMIAARYRFPPPPGLSVRPSALESAKLALYAEMTMQGARKLELARRLG